MTEDGMFLGKGFQFPPRVDPTTGRFCLSEGEEDIREAVYLILMTRKGERPMEPDFGCNIENYIFDLPESGAERGMKDAIETALIRWEPRINDVKVAINTNRLQDGLIYIQIGYTVRKNNNPVNLVFPYYLEEGTGVWR
ncbi:MAG: GPW/gp25 family protein [Kineothrix sp.]